MKLLFCKTCPAKFKSLFPEHLRNPKRLQLYWKEFHGNLHFAKVTHNAKSGVSKTTCVSSGGMNDTDYYVCLYITLSQRLNYSIYYTWEERLPPDKIIGDVVYGLGNKAFVNNLILESMHPFTWIGVGSDYQDYNFQVFIPTRVSATGSMTGLLSPFDLMTWMSLLVSGITSWLLFCIISKNLGNWLRRTVFGKSLQPINLVGDNVIKKANISWKMVMAAWLLSGIFLAIFYGGELYSNVTIQVEHCFFANRK